LPFLPVYVAKATGFIFVVFGVTALMGGLLSINPVWKYGPYNPAQVSAGSQPDWYLGFAEGELRLMPGWESEFFGHTIPWSVVLPAQVLPVILVVAFLGWPFLEAWASGDKREHHLLQRPRNAPTRTAFLAASITFYGCCGRRRQRHPGHPVAPQPQQHHLCPARGMHRVAGGGVRGHPPVVPFASGR
jgi:ubiquinol-cytochrome c reductase cytochrome b subunit